MNVSTSRSTPPRRLRAVAAAAATGTAVAVCSALLWGAESAPHRITALAASAPVCTSAVTIDVRPDFVPRSASADTAERIIDRRLGIRPVRMPEFLDAPATRVIRELGQ